MYSHTSIFQCQLHFNMLQTSNKKEFQKTKRVLAVQNFDFFLWISFLKVKEFIPRNLKMKWENFIFLHGFSERYEIWTSFLAHINFRTFPVPHLKILRKSIDLVILESLKIFSSVKQKMVVICLSIF